MEQLLNEINMRLKIKYIVHTIDCEIINKTNPLKFRDERVIEKLKYFMKCAIGNNKIKLNTSDKIKNEYINILRKNIVELENMCFDMNTRDLNGSIIGNTILHWTIFNSCVYSALFLVNNRKEFNLNINVQEKAGYTPLHVSIIKGRYRCNNDACELFPPMGQLIDVLLDCDDIDLTIIDQKNNNIIDLAMILYDYETLKKISDNGFIITPKKHIIDKCYININYDFDEYGASIMPAYYNAMDNDKKKQLLKNYNAIKAFLVI